jgi:hypothetical protein
MTRTSKSTAAAVAAGLVAFAAALSAGSAGHAAALAPTGQFKRLDSVKATTSQAVATARTADGVLHLAYQTLSGTSVTGLSTMAISPSGKAGPAASVVSGWPAGQPGLLALPGGTLETVFGAISPNNESGVWGVSSTNGGVGWTAPAVVGAGGQYESLAYGADVTGAVSGTQPVLALPSAGNLVVQSGLGGGAATAVITTQADGSTTDADLAVDAASGQVVAGWPSVAHEPTLYLQGVAPGIGSAEKVPGQSRNAVVLAGRDSGPGVFAAYTTDGKHVRLMRYAAGSVAVGSRAGTTAKVLGVATGPAGRIWVMWGDDSGGGVAVTRSNKAVTRFEPIQQVALNPLSLYRLQGDGRLGPLDLLADAIAGKGPAVSGLYYARVLPVFSTTVAVQALKNGKGAIVGHKLTATVTDAGDPVSGATVSAGGKQAKTGSKGSAVLSFGASTVGALKLTVTAPGYAPGSQTVNI